MTTGCINLPSIIQIIWEKCVETQLKANNAGLELMPKYVDMPKLYTYQSKHRRLAIRKQKHDTIGRVHSVGPASGDLYYLRMLLHHNHCQGKTSFTDLRTVNGEVCETYQRVCEGLGLLQGDVDTSML